MLRISTALLIVLVSFHSLGCSSAEYDKSAGYKSKSAEKSNAFSVEDEGWSNESTAEYGDQKVDSDTNKAVSANSPARKIIYTAELSIVVEQFDDVQSRISKLVEKHGGFISSANLGRMTGERRSGSWTVRIPVKNYHDFLNAVGDIGVPESRNENASDVTEEFVDIGARIENKKKLEARILELLDRPDDKIQHVIEVERELARVREAIERMEGRLRYLTDATSLTTVDINIREERDYIPPQAPTLTSRISNAWSASVINGRRFLENLVVFIVGNAIGFGIFLLACLIAIPILRIIWRKVARMLKPKTRERSRSTS